jgi:hypothetical protein
MYIVSLYVRVAAVKKRSKRNTWIADLLLILYSRLRVRCPVTPTVVTSLWTFRVWALVYDVCLVGSVDVNMSKDGCFLQRNTKQEFLCLKIADTDHATSEHLHHL